MSDTEPRAVAAPANPCHHQSCWVYPALRACTDQPRGGTHGMADDEGTVRARLFIGAALLALAWLIAITTAVLCIVLMPPAVVTDNLDVIFGVPALAAGVVTWTVSNALF